MRGTGTAAALVLLLTAGLPRTAFGQPPAKPAGTDQERPERFLGLDVFGGGIGFEVPAVSETEEAKCEYKWGWDAGGTVSFGVRWLGITGAFLYYSVAEDVPAYHLVAGPRVRSPWGLGAEIAVRAFAHALVGFAHAGGDAPPKSSPEWVVGGGVDLLLFRFQLDYVRLNLNGLPKNNSRVFVGGFVPLCFRACSESKALIDLSGRPATK